MTPKEIAEGIKVSLKQYGVAYTYDNEGDMVLLDPKQITIHKEMSAITYGDGNPILFEGKKLIFSGVDEAKGALTILGLLKPLDKYQIEKYDPNKKIIRI